MVAITPLPPIAERPALRLVPPARRTPNYAVRRVLALFVLVTMVAAAALVVDVAGDALVPASSPTGTAPDLVDADAAAVHVVAPGDTLWSIAATTAPDRDPRAVVDELVDLNGSPSIRIGQRIVLPPS